MAVVSISRIQIRRGRKNQGTGLPQLASGEFGWAVDSQELYIGNGSVAEGAPYVGNTKILSERDDLFEFARSYTYLGSTAYMQTGSDINVPVQRSLQDRLDDRVSIRAFGASGDGSNQTAELQRAIDQLFLNPATKTSNGSRVVLHIEPGTYVIDSTIYVPPYATIIGAGVDKTVITMTGTGPAFKTVNSSSTIGTPALHSTTTITNQPTNIILSGMTVNIPSNEIGLQLDSCINSLFQDIKFAGEWISGDAGAISENAIRLNSLNFAVTTKNNSFSRIQFNNMSYGVYSDYDVTNNLFSECIFKDNYISIAFGNTSIIGSTGQSTGPFQNTIKNSSFSYIDRQAILVVAGTGNISTYNRFSLVGNEGGTTADAAYPVIQFDDVLNTSEGDWFDRSRALGYDETYIINTAYIPEVQGPTFYQNSYTHKLQINFTGTYEKLFKLPADSRKSFEIEYMYVSSQVNATRTGTLYVVVDPVNNTQALSDEYDYIGDSAYQETLKFKAQTFDENGDLSIDTIAVMMLNSTTSDVANFYYRVKTKV